MASTLSGVLNQINRTMAVIKENDMLCDVCKERFLPGLRVAASMLESHIAELNDNEIVTALNNEKVIITLTRQQYQDVTRVLELEVYKAFPTYFMEVGAPRTFEAYSKLISADMAKMRLDFRLEHARDELLKIRKRMREREQLEKSFCGKMSLTSETSVFL